MSATYKTKLILVHRNSDMKVFCYDLMLVGLASARQPLRVPWRPLRLGERSLAHPLARPASPGFLIHDSTIYDGVDERQRAAALELAASESLAHGFQLSLNVGAFDT